jgi:hypothetical protein
MASQGFSLLVFDDDRATSLSIPPSTTPTKSSHASERLNIHAEIKEKLQTFYDSKKIPHLIFHGASGTGKMTLVHDFIHLIYQNDKQKIKTNVMTVNCSHGKGIKFIREELKFFAKTNIQTNSGVLFKTILLLNAHHLTIDAQSALRRCIELFSYNTRFFIVVEDKNKLLKPILSRFCEIYVPEYINPEGQVVHLGKSSRPAVNTSWDYLDKRMREYIDCPQKDSMYLADLAQDLYEQGVSALDMMEWIKLHADSIFGEDDAETHLASLMMQFHRIKPEFRSEKLLMYALLCG